MPTHQYSFDLITHHVADSPIQQRSSDGYINATAMCKAAGKLFGHYRENAVSRDFLDELATDIGIPISGLIQSVKGGAGAQGTWVHPHVALHLAQWLSPKFAVQVTKWVHDWMTGKHVPAKLPYHLERHMLNLHKIPADHFSVLQEMTAFLVGPLEANGHRLHERHMPDISQAKMLCKRLRERFGLNTDTLPKYRHTFPDGREVEANLYPARYLETFRKLMQDEWLPHKAQEYFQKRDPSALPALDRLLLLKADAPKPTLPANRPAFRKKA